jgi:hypothetical protein
MTSYDVFNGDADGLCSLQQLRLASPRDAKLVSGVKRDIALLARVTAQPGDSVTALDVSLDANRDALLALLDLGVQVVWFDHHYAASIPRHPLLDATIDPSPEVCTSILVDRAIGGRHRRWAIVGAFGDNLRASAERLADAAGIRRTDREAMRMLGEALAYNAYGERECDLVIAPADLFLRMRGYVDPLRFLAENPVCERIVGRQSDDLAHARRERPASVSQSARVFVLPDVPWSRRVHGVFANELAQAEPALAHAVVVPDSHGRYTASVRAPVARPFGADALCRAFGGDGRAGAGGIGGLDPQRLAAFVEALHRAYAPR